MRSRVEKPLPVPARLRRYRPADWPGGWAEFAAEREAWSAAQEPVLIAGQHDDGRMFAYLAGPLGDKTDLIRMRREARGLDIATAYSGSDPVAAPAEPEPGSP